MKTHLVLETVAVDLLAPVGARTSTGTVMTKFLSVYMELEIWNLKKLKNTPSTLLSAYTVCYPIDIIVLFLLSCIPKCPIYVMGT